MLTAIGVTGLLCLVILVACSHLGDPAPQGGSEPPPESVDDRIGKMDLDSGEPPEDKPAAPPDKPPAAPPAKDRTENWSKDMTDLEQFIPEDRKQTYRNKVEQASRWGKGEEDPQLAQLQTDFGTVKEVATEVASWFEDGPEKLEKLGPVAFLNELKGIDPAIFAKEPDEAPPAEGATPEGEKTELEKRLEKLEQATQQAQTEKEKAQQEVELQKAEAAFHKEFDPAADKVVQSFEVAEADRDGVSKAFTQLAQYKFSADAYESPSTATATSAVESTKSLIDTIVNARLSKRPTRPSGTVRVDPDKAGAEHVASGAETFTDRLDMMSDDLKSDLSKGPEG